MDRDSQTTALEALGINVGEALMRFAGKYELYLKTTRSFCMKYVSDGMPDVAVAKAMEQEELRRYLHGIKGVTANLAMKDAHKRLIALEQTVKDGTPDFALYEETSAYLTKLSTDVLAIVAPDEEKPLEANAGSRTSVGSTTSIGSRDECKALLASLSEYLQGGRAKESEEIVSRLAGRSWDDIDVAALGKVITAVEGYDYMGAMELIKDV